MVKSAAWLTKTAYKVFADSSTAVDPVTGQVYADYYDIFTIGAGYLDMQAALADISLATGTALSGSQAVWGTRAVWGNQATWGTRSVWGTSTADAVEATMILANREK